MVMDDVGGVGTPAQLVHFDAAGVQLPTVTTTNAESMALHSSNDFLLADSEGQRIARVTSAGAIVSTTPISGVSFPLTGLTVDFDQTWFALSGNSAVGHIAAGGAFSQVTSIGPNTPFVQLTDLIQFRPANTFEFFVDGSPACSSCAVTNQFAQLGTTLSFLLTNQTVPTNAQLSGPTLFDRPSDGSNHSITAFGTLTSWLSGTMTITTAGHPETVTFRVHGNNLVPSFPISAADTQNNQITVERRNVFTYTVGSNVAREETIVITSPNGVSTVTVGMPSFVLFIDDFMLTRPPVIIF